jgi:catechol 2,3-dioxygenase-like lactoylglutathione lyase family enzyme
MAIRRVSHAGLLVGDQGEALQWYTEKLGFEKREDDSETIPAFRWLTVGPKDQED